MTYRALLAIVAVVALEYLASGERVHEHRVPEVHGNRQAREFILKNRPHWLQMEAEMRAENLAFISEEIAAIDSLRASYDSLRTQWSMELLETLQELTRAEELWRQELGKDAAPLSGDGLLFPSDTGDPKLFLLPDAIDGQVPATLQAP